MKLSEAAAFRWVVIIVIAAGSIIGLTLLTRPLVGALWGVVLVCIGVAYGYQRLKEG